MFSPKPPLTLPDDVDEALLRHGYAVVDRSGLCQLVGASELQLASLATYWGQLPPDAWLRDGGRYRRRRHGSFIVQGDLSVRSVSLAPPSGPHPGADHSTPADPPGVSIEHVPHRPHWQPRDYNALHGGLHRTFAELEPGMVQHPAWSKLLVGLAARATALRGGSRWFVEAHPFRIDTTGGIGRPTPEGAHRDGVDLVVVILIERTGVKGGETRVFDADGPNGIRFTLTEPWSALLLDDARVIHESTPIQPVGAHGHRDTLVLTFRAGGFLAPP